MTIDDLVIEDAELAQALQDITEFELAAAQFRGAKKRAKDILIERHPEAINAQTVDGRPRWAVVDGNRFLPRTATRPAAQRPAGPGINWRLEVHKVVTSVGE